MSFEEKIKLGFAMLFAAFAANNGAPLFAVVFIVYVITVFFVHSMTDDLFDKNVPGASWVLGILVAEYLAEIINLTGDTPPFLPADDIVGKVAWLLFAWFASYYLSKSGTKVCKECGTPVIEEKNEVRGKVLLCPNAECSLHARPLSPNQIDRKGLRHLRFLGTGSKAVGGGIVAIGKGAGSLLKNRAGTWRKNNIQQEDVLSQAQSALNNPNNETSTTKGEPTQ